MASAEPSGTTVSNREQCADVFLRAWLCAKCPLATSEMQKELKLLGSALARDVILRAGGLDEFISRTPELTIIEGQIVLVPVSNSSRPAEQSLLAQMNKLTVGELAAMNRTHERIQLASKTGDVVNALQKREQLEELRRECRRKKITLEERKRQLSELKSFPTAERKQQTFNELRQHRDRLRAQVDHGKSILKKQRDLDEVSLKVDKRVGVTEDQLNRLILKIKRTEERIVIMRRDGFSETKQLERDINENLRQHDADRDRTINVLDVIVEEKCAHSRAVLERHIASVKKLLDERALLVSEADEDNLCGRLQEDQQKLVELNTAEKSLRMDLREARAALTQVVQLPVIELIQQLHLDSTKSTGPQSKARHSLILGSLVHDELPYELSKMQDTIPMQIPDIDDNRCSICLHEILPETSEALICSHSFHSSCLSDMRSSGYDLCPLCRRYEPPPALFPSLTDADNDKGCISHS